ncbi:ribonuclease H-like domain-containing protein [Caproiciproducens sp. MSJ-32]|uniref:ribonuclease H-like domain-containing protein n=1 Tax=Caproiciproducens sp. MSJ-32 TaxID=2841527 RepID=UPI001C11DA7E|nr:ribonuclease H-like domain-containing protein [Caproiciproducens sp. MSJ-32]MBU5455409.1 ribonuclease H-like domain-containing protein [Caproiciproducens sp. MSJ-32]
MEKHDYLINSKFNKHKYFHDKNVCFLDIETTGLSRKFNQIYLIGLVYFNNKNKSWYLSQFFANNINEEHILLEQVNKFISKFNLLVTYNGDSFDIPFIKHRFKIHKINNNISSTDSFDIYRKIKKYDSYLPFDNLKLKTIEKNLNIFREDKYTGKDCINFYYEYINTKDDTLKDKILKHNFDDLYYLLDIMQIFDVIQNIKNFDIEYNDKFISIEIDEINLTGDIINIYCNILVEKPDINFIYFGDTFNIIQKDKNHMIIKLEVNEGFITPTKKCLFINKSKLPPSIYLEDMTEYMLPEDVFILKIENKYQMKNIKKLIKQLMLYILNF